MAALSGGAGRRRVDRGYACNVELVEGWGGVTAVMRAVCGCGFPAGMGVGAGMRAIWGSGVGFGFGV